MPIPTREVLRVERVPRRLLTISDIAELLGPTSPGGKPVSRKRADQISQRKGFPEPFGILRNNVRVWDEDAVKTWIADNRESQGPSPET